MRLLRIVCLCLVVTAAFSFAAFAAEAEKEQGVGGSDFHKNDITYSMEVVTPHTDWAPVLPGGPIKGFFIPSVEFGRDMVELMQRVQLEPTTVSIDRNWDTNCWGIGDYYGHQYRGNRDDFRLVFNYVERDITGPAKFEVMVIPGLNGWSRMTRATRDAILKRVEEGAGLVLIHPFVGDIKGHPFMADPLVMNGTEQAGDEDAAATAYETEIDTRLWDISPLVGCADDSVSEKGYPVINRDAIAKGNWEIAAKHFITAGLPVELLPEGVVGNEFYKYKANGDVLVRSGDYPVVAVKNYGKGRVVAFAYVEEGFTPKSVDQFEAKIGWNYWEYQYSLLTKAIVWAAQREGSVQLASCTASADGARLVLNAAAATKVTIDLSGRSQYGQPMGSARIDKDLAAGENVVEIPAETLKGKSGWAGGTSIFDLIVRDGDGATLDWGTATFEVPKRAMIAEARLAADVYMVGETLSAVVSEAGAFEGLTTRFKVTDDLDRVIGVVEKPARQERYFTVSLADYLGKYAFVTVDLVDANGAVMDQLCLKPALVVQNTRRASDFQATLAFGGGKSFLTNTQAAQIRNGGAMSGFTWGGGVDNGLNIPRGSFGIYWYDRGPTTADGIQAAIDGYNKDGDFDALGYLTKKELYARTGDKKFLTRTPCLDDPEFLKTLSDIVYATARGKSRYNLDYYFVGDEGSITSYSDAVDFCWGPYTMAAFRKWLGGQYGSIDNLNAEWKTSYKSWDEVVPVTTEDALKSGNFAPWSDHRTYMEIAFARAYQTVRDAVVKGDPEGNIAVSGTQSTNAYDGCDWYRLDQIIDDFLSYNGGNQWDLHRSFAKPGAMIGYWTGYGSSGIAVQNAIWGAAIHNVLYPNIFWLPSYLNPDLTYSKSARDMGDAFKALKFEGVGKLFMESKRLQDGIAIYYSMPSVHAASITGNYGSRGENAKPGRSLSGDQDGWVRSINELGMQFDFVSYDQAPKGKLSSGEYKVAIFPMTMAMSPDEVKAVRKFADDGGTVIADSMVGVMNDHCSWQEKGLVNDLFGIKVADSSKRAFIVPETPRRAPGQSTDTAAGAAARPRNIESTGAAVAAVPLPEVKVTKEGAKWGFDAAKLTGIRVVENGVEAKGGTVLVTVGGVPAVIARKAGKGTAVYLNVLFDQMGGSGRRRRDTAAPAAPDPSAAYRAVIGTVLAHAGVEPSIKVTTPDGNPITRAQIVRYQFGDQTVLAMVKEMAYGGATTGMDGVTYYNDSNLGKVARQDITISLPGKFTVTDVRTGEKLATATDSLKTSIVVGGPLVLGLTKADNKIDVTGPASARLGDHVQFAVKTASAGATLVRCHFYAPDGSFVAAYAKNVVIKGSEGSIVLPSALNDAAGDYKLTVTDVVSGATAETKVTMQ